MTVLFWEGQKAQEKEHSKYQNTYSSLFNQNSVGTRNIHKCLLSHQSRTEIECFAKNRTDSSPTVLVKLLETVLKII